MLATNSILIVDDEDSFCHSTAELFRREGYACDCASDADEALEKLKANQYDVLISDIKMPGNADLRLVRRMPQLAPTTRVILVTGYPSVDSAISAIELPVVAYLRKPVDHTELQRHVRSSVEASHRQRTLSHVRHLLKKCVHELEDLERVRAPDCQVGVAVPPGVAQALAACLSELLHLEAVTGGLRGVERMCELLNCPQWRIHRRAFVDTIDILKATRHRFKSKQLAELRARLEQVLADSRPPSEDEP